MIFFYDCDRISLSIKTRYLLYEYFDSILYQQFLYIYEIHFRNRIEMLKISLEIFSKGQHGVTL